MFSKLSMHLEVHISIVSIRVLSHVFVLKSVSLYNKDFALKWIFQSLDSRIFLSSKLLGKTPSCRTILGMNQTHNSNRPLTISGFHVTSLPPCWWTVNKRSLISSLCLSTSICSFHHCYLCLPRLHENHLYARSIWINSPDYYNIQWKLS